ncbi:MAG: tetratricopeptide repeat protein [Vicinamibacteraceae bacterium]|nr:tetratricopeptide repeat protein [Vicinamibacteraceae bacterium]
MLRTCPVGFLLLLLFAFATFAPPPSAALGQVKVPQSPPVDLKTPEARRLAEQGDLAFDANDLEAVAAACREVVRLEPGVGEAWFRLGYVLERPRQSEEAVDAFERVAALEPAHWAVHAYLGRERSHHQSHRHASVGRARMCGHRAAGVVRGRTVPGAGLEPAPHRNARALPGTTLRSVRPQGAGA